MRRQVSRRQVLFLLCFLCGALALGAYFFWDFVVQRNVAAVVPGRLYRSGQPRAEQLERWIEKYKLRTILVLKPTLETFEKEIADRTGIKLYHIVLSSQQGPSEAQWQQIRGLLTGEENWPLLYHCQDGADKTGIVTAMYRIEVQGWPLWKALLEMDLHYHIPLSRPGLQRFLKERYAQRDRQEGVW